MRLIGVEGEQIGVVPIIDALSKAEEAGLDLVEIAPTVNPPVCRIMDYGKYLFEISKRQKNKAKQIQIKEVKLRPVTEIGDYTIKIRKAKDFLLAGNKVKFTVRFRGREMNYQQLGIGILQRAENDLKDCAVVEQLPRIEGRQLTMFVAPAKAQKK